MNPKLFAILSVLATPLGFCFVPTGLFSVAYGAYALKSSARGAPGRGALIVGAIAGVMNLLVIALRLFAVFSFESTEPTPFIFEVQ